MTRILPLSLLAVVAALALAACGSSGSSSSGHSGYSAPSSSQPAAPAAGSSAASVATAKGSLGTFLVDAKGRALYLWDADKGSMSTCSGACAQAWPPLTTSAKPKAGSGVDASLLGTTKRADGSLEVTYAGHPLYYFAGDSGPGQTAGQGSNGFGAPWWIVSPGGKALQN
jgi:predicted lipoprotein with Yx(FWY)xxD motif